MEIVSTQQLTLGYSDKDGNYSCIVEQFNISVSAGQIISLLGPSGIGKSSLLGALAGLKSIHSGKIYFLQQELTAPNSKISFIFQTPALLPWRNVLENTIFGLNFKKQPKISKHEAKSRALQALLEVGLEKDIYKYPHELSGGMLQRVALARCIVRQSKLILLDEPLAALDEISRHQMQVLIKNLVAKYNSALILVTHDIDEALLISNKIYLLGGKPSKIIAKWKLPILMDITEPNAMLLSLQQERTEILRTLRSAQLPKSPSKHLEYMI